MPVAVRRRGQEPDQRGQNEGAGHDVAIAAVHSETRDAEHAEDEHGDEHGRDGLEVTQAPRDETEEQSAQRGERRQTLSHVQVLGLRRKAEHHATEPPLPGCLVALGWPKREPQNPLHHHRETQTTHQRGTLAKYPDFKPRTARSPR